MINGIKKKMIIPNKPIQLQKSSINNKTNIRQQKLIIKKIKRAKNNNSQNKEYKDHAEIIITIANKDKAHNKKIHI